MHARNAFFAFLGGLAAYPLIELAWRGWTHWTMSILGGVCFMACYLVYVALPRRSLLFRAAVSGIIVTELEFITGVIVNLALHWHVWDYSHLWGNLAGQICPLYSFFWFLLSLGDMLLIRYARRRSARAAA